MENRHIEGVSGAAGSTVMTFMILLSIGVGLYPYF